jgi:hypothetical protein
MNLVLYIQFNVSNAKWRHYAVKIWKVMCVRLHVLNFVSLNSESIYRNGVEKGIQGQSVAQTQGDFSYHIISRWIVTRVRSQKEFKYYTLYPICKGMWCCMLLHIPWWRLCNKLMTRVMHNKFGSIKRKWYKASVDDFGCYCYED